MDTSTTNLLTPRQKELLAHLEEGARPKEIAERLCLSEATVRMHIRDALCRLSAHSVVVTVRAARRLGLLPDNEGMNVLGEA